MRSYLSLTFKELKKQRIMAVLILIAVILSTAMTTVLTQSLGILQSMRLKQAASLNGDRYATFHQLTEEQAKALHEDSRLFDVGDLINVGNLSIPDSSLTLYLREYHQEALEHYPSLNRLKEGSLPEHAGEIALSEETLRYLGSSAVPGEKISLKLSVGLMDGSLPDHEYTADFTLTGILENDYLGYASGTLTGVAGEGTAKKLLPKEYLLYSTDFKTRDKQTFQSTVDDLAASLSLDEKFIQYNWLLLNALGISHRETDDSSQDSGFSFMALASVLIGALVLFAAGLVIYNILRISVARKQKEYGTLRAMGATRGHLYRLVTLTLLLLCGAGIPLGLLLGVLFSKTFLISALGLLNPKLFLSDSTEALNASILSAKAVDLPLLLLSASVTLLFAVAASFPAARYAARVSPTVALQGSRTSFRRSRKRKRRIRSFEAYYARLNLKRSKGRTAITILSLVMSVAVFVALQSFTGLLDASQDVQDMYTGDYAVTNENSGLPVQAVKELASNEQVESLATARLTVFSPGEKLPFDLSLSLTSHETLQIASLDDESLLSLAPGLDEEERQALLSGEGCLVKNPIRLSYGDTPMEYTELQAGDTVTIQGRTLKVLGITDHPVTINNEGFVNGVQLLVNGQTYCELLKDDRYSEVYPTLKERADTSLFESWLSAWSQSLPGTHYLSYLDSREQMEESFEQIHMLCWALILFVGAIGILNIINTVYTNIHTRVSEIGIQRAIGMSAESLSKTFLWEGAYYGIIASLLGAALGYVCCVFVGAARTDTLSLVEIPVWPILQASSLSIAACLAATAVPLRGIKKRGIVEEIGSVE